MAQYPEFKNIEVSTKTIIGVSNINIDIENLFNKLPITSYHVIPKRRGRKKKADLQDNINNLEQGSIITLKYQGDIRGVDLKAKKHSKKSNKKYFRNALTVVMYIDNKFINYKVSKNGKFQITGCKKVTQGEKCVKYFWNLINKISGEPLFTYTNGNNPYVIFFTVMTNIDFNVGFLVNRENLDAYINKYTINNSLLETSFGYTGVNIKFPFTEKIDIDLKKISWENNKWKDGWISYDNYLNIIDPKDKQKELRKKRYNTFLVFHSGNVIMSGMIQKYMENGYNSFIEIIKSCRNDIEEKLVEM